MPLLDDDALRINMLPLTIFISLVALAFSDYKQSLQFQHLNEEKQNIQVEVCDMKQPCKIESLDFDTLIWFHHSVVLRLLGVAEGFKYQYLIL